jgi:hypothetical protein
MESGGRQQRTKRTSKDSQPDINRKLDVNTQPDVTESAPHQQA